MFQSTVIPRQALLSNSAFLEPGSSLTKHAPGVPLGEARSGNADTAGCLRTAVQWLDAHNSSPAVLRSKD